MHTIEKQVSSLELSKRLKELGVPQESYFQWAEKREHFVLIEKVEAGKPFITHEKPPYDFPYKHLAAAFTVAELGAFLPKDTVIRTYKLSKSWQVNYDLFESAANTEADARAKCLIYLIENGLLDVKTLSV